MSKNKLCVGICTLDADRNYCIGCNRTIQEIMEKGNGVSKVQPSPTEKTGKGIYKSRSLL